MNVKSATGKFGTRPGGSHGCESVDFVIVTTSSAESPTASLTSYFATVLIIRTTVPLSLCLGI